MADGLEARIDRVEVNLERVVGILTTLADNVVCMSETVIRMSETIIRLEEGQRHNDEAISVLVRMMDEWIRNNPTPVILRATGQVG